jgi:hypothetical protein
MKSYGAIRKVMLIVLLSILGSYCIGSDRNESMSSSSFDYAMQSTYGVFVSIGTYCHKLWSEMVDKVMTVFGKDDDQKVKIQLVDDRVHGNNLYCTDGKADCIYNNEFFNDTYVTGVLDEDSDTHLDVDSDPMKLIDANEIPHEVDGKYNVIPLAPKIPSTNKVVQKHKNFAAAGA